METLSKLKVRNQGILSGDSAEIESNESRNTSWRLCQNED